jgi:cysteine synthase
VVHLVGGVVAAYAGMQWYNVAHYNEVVRTGTNMFMMVERSAGMWPVACIVAATAALVGLGLSIAARN